MKKLIFLLSLILVVIFLITSQPATAVAQLAGSFQTTDAPLSQEYFNLLPAGYTIPKTLPSNIHDPLLLTGWIYIYNQTHPIRTWNGETLTGRMMAQYVLNEQVTIQWNTINECSGYSCTKRPSAREACNASPILIALSLQSQGSVKINQLVGAMAHEIYHHMLPFGNILDTMFEEYWAYSTGEQISMVYWMNTANYDPMKSACLKQWFQVKKIDYYDGFDAYPQGVGDAADTSSTTCVSDNKQPTW
jgi:hypothetical protein